MKFIYSRTLSFFRQPEDQVKSLPAAINTASPHRTFHPDRPIQNNTEKKQQDTYISVTPMMCICGIAIVTYIVSVIIREVVQIHQQKWQYLLEPNNCISWILCISAGIMVSPVFTNGYINDLHFTASSITVFLSWFNLLLFLQRFDQVRTSSIIHLLHETNRNENVSLQIGIYVVMFLEILQTLIKVLFVFSILIIAFGLAFYILMAKVTLDFHHRKFMHRVVE